MRLLPDIRYGTRRYPENVARRLRSLNMATWIAAAVAVIYSVAQFLDSTPGLWKVAGVNAIGALILTALPLLHRFGALAAPIGLIVTTYAYFFLVCSMIGTASGMEMYYPIAAALGVLLLGIDRIVLAAAIGVVAALLIITLEAVVPRTTGLQPASTMFGNFIGTAFASTGVLLAIVFYALREAARAEATAQREQERSDSLLANILPAEIADRLKNRTETVIADRYDEATILFADMAGFTARTGDTTPDELVRFLNRVFSDFDRLVERHGLEKIKTTGDAYMVVSGVPTRRADHAEALARLALDMQEVAADLRDPHGRDVPIRMGIASGPVVAGVVGTRKFFYDVWGDAVNVASRMESTGAAGQIQLSQEVYERLKDDLCWRSAASLTSRERAKCRRGFSWGLSSL
jgi:adenylate cyclase